jgi:dsDNA-specific endonuclease/ATPase MutS2
LSKNLQKATSHLTELNSDYDSRLEEAKGKVSEANKFYDEAILKAKTEAESMKVQIIQEARDAQEALLKEARKNSEDILDQAHKTKEAMMQEIEALVEGRSLEKSGELLESMLPAELGDLMHAYWFGELCKQGLEELGRLNLPSDVTEAKVSTAYPLKADQKEKLEKILKDKLSRPMKLSETVDKALIMGVKVTLGSVVVDGSLRHKIKETLKNARNSTS